MADRPLSIDIHHPLLLKANDLVLLTREDGEIVEEVPGFGLFYRDTCYLASYALRLHGTAPLLLMSSDGEGLAAQMNLTNSHLATSNGQVIADHKLSLRRNFLVLDDGPVFIDTISMRNFTTEHLLLPLSLAFSTTFESMFALRGAPVGKRGRLQVPECEGNTLRFAYQGADDVLRTLLVEFSRKPVVAPITTEQSTARFQLSIASMATEELMVICRVDERPVGSKPPVWADAPRSVTAMREAQVAASAALLDGYAGIETPSQGLGEVMARSLADALGQGQTRAVEPGHWRAAAPGEDRALPTGAQVEVQAVKRQGEAFGRRIRAFDGTPSMMPGGWPTKFASASCRLSSASCSVPRR